MKFTQSPKKYLSTSHARWDPKQTPECRLTPPCYCPVKLTFHRPPNCLQMTVTFRLWSVNKGFTTQLDKSKTHLIDCAGKPHPQRGNWGHVRLKEKSWCRAIGEAQPWIRLTRRKSPLTAQDRKTVSEFPFEILWNSRRFHKSRKEIIESCLSTALFLIFSTGC